MRNPATPPPVAAARRVASGSIAACSRASSSAQCDDAQAAVEMLDQRRAALHPVAVVAVEDAVDVADLGLMDVAADHAVDAAPARLAGDRVLEVGR